MLKKQVLHLEEITFISIINMAEYIKQEMSDLDGTGKQRVFYRMKTYYNINAKDFISKLAHPGSGLTEGNVIHVLTTLADELAYYMGEGYSVTIDGVGTFKPTLGIVRGKEIDTIDGNEQKRNARSLMVNGVNFRASKELVKETNKRCKLKRAGISYIRHSPYTKQQRIKLALKFIDEHHFMRIADYMELTGLRRTTATLELKELREDPTTGITTEGRGSGKVYVRRTNP